MFGSKRNEWRDVRGFTVDVELVDVVLARARGRVSSEGVGVRQITHDVLVVEVVDLKSKVKQWNETGFRLWKNFTSRLLMLSWLLF